MFSFPVESFLRYLEKFVDWCYDGIQSLEYKTIAETAACFHLTENYLRLIEKRALDVLREGMNDGKIL